MNDNIICLQRMLFTNIAVPAIEAMVFASLGQKRYDVTLPVKTLLSQCGKWSLAQDDWLNKRAH